MLIKRLLITSLVLFFFVGPVHAENIDTSGTNESYNGADFGNNDKVEVIVFVRDGCGVCKNEEEYLASHYEITKNFSVQILNIGDDVNKQKWQELVDKHKLSKVTPITLVGGDVLVGFNEKTTGEKILGQAANHASYGMEYYLRGDDPTNADSENAYCQADSVGSCSLEDHAKIASREDSMMMLPYFGEIDVKKTSLFLISAVLGFIDGFNPCAMWVLLTFLILLSQVGSKKKMIYLAGIFILAEAIMYFLILNVWYETWDFIKLDQWVTPAVGLLAVSAGCYFLYKSYKTKSKGVLTCEVTSLEHQQKTTQKIKDAISKPITIITILSVLGIAFSVNIIEFACSVGIAQSFTKILQINAVSFLVQQWYIFIYSLFYMADDFLIFGLAIAGYQRFHVVGAKYSHLSTILGGILMIIMGILLMFYSDILVF